MLGLVARLSVAVLLGWVMHSLTMGANAAIEDARFDLLVEWPAAAGVLDCSAFMLGRTGQVRGDHDMIFYNQRHSVDGAVELADDGRGFARFAVDLGRVQREVDRIVLCVTVDDPAQTISSFQGTRATLGGAAAALRFEPDLRAASEAALMLVEVYRRGEAWKLRAIGQGFNQGLAALAGAFGVDVEGGGDTPAPPPPAPKPADLSTLDFTDSAPADPAIRFARSQPQEEAAIRLDAGREVHVWPAADAPITAELAWSSRQGGADGRPRPLMLRLGLHYRLADGRSGILQHGDADRVESGSALLALGPPSAVQADHSVAATLAGWPGVQRVTLYAYVDGSPNWSAATAELRLRLAGQPAVSVPIGSGQDGFGAVALARIEPGDAGLRVERLMTFGHDQRAIDAEFGWGLRWRPAAP